MNHSTVNFTTESSTNFTTHNFELIDSVNICILSFCCIFGFPTHSYVIWLIFTETGGEVASEFFILNLSVCEINICLNCFIHVISYWVSLSTVKMFFVGLTITGRPLFQCLICVERYLAVVHPVIYLKYKPLRYRVICCAAAWILILGSCVFCLHIISDVNNYFYTYVWIISISIQFLLFLSFQLFCLVSVLRALKQSGPGDRKRKVENHIKKRAFYLILIITVTMTVMYGPYIIIGFLCIMIKQVIDPLWTTAFLCYMMAGFVHPVLYLHRAGKLSCLCLLQYL